tara:strand:+ start:173 stop:487 length:315 start_codon:yes stop_codon:yes gene_type:complete
MSKETVDKINNNLIMLVEGFDDAERDYGYDLANEKHYVSELIDLVKNLSLSGVGSSFTTKKYEIDFGTHLRCGIDVTNNELNILGAMDGWGNGVSKDVIVIKEL